MTGKVEIRPYEISDKEQLVQLLKLNIPQYFAERELEDFENYLENEIEAYFVAEINNQLIGAGGINFEKEINTAKISWDFIHPSYHGKGIGGKLLQHRLEILKNAESSEIILVRTSQLVYKFYEKSGFVLQEIVEDYWAKGFDLYVMKYAKYQAS